MLLRQYLCCVKHECLSLKLATKFNTHCIHIGQYSLSYFKGDVRNYIQLNGSAINVLITAPKETPRNLIIWFKKPMQVFLMSSFNDED